MHIQSAPVAASPPMSPPFESPVAAAPPTQNGRGSGPGEIETLRLLSTEIRDLRIVLGRVRAGEVPLSHYAEYIRRNVRQIDEIIGTLQGDDCIRPITNAWEQMSSFAILKDPEEELDAQRQMQILALLDELCRRITYWTAHLTVPDRLQSWLKGSSPGYAIPFHSVFDDEVPDAEDRQRILNHLAWSPVHLERMGGVVDPHSGLVYRYDAGKSWLRSIAPIVLMVLGGVAAVWLLTRAGIIPGTDPFPVLVVGWAALLMGTLVHVGVGTAKRLKSQDPAAAVLPVSRFLIMINARQGFIFFQVGMALLGYLALIFSNGGYTDDNLQAFAFNAFLAGYGLDSVVELFGTSLDDRAAAQTAGLKQKLGGA